MTKEIQADCFAGAWTAHADGGTFKPSSDDLDHALAGFLYCATNPGPRSRPQHGSGYDRADSFRTGFESGAGACKAYRDGDPIVVQLRYRGSPGVANASMSYDDVISMTPLIWRTTGRMDIRIRPANHGRR